MYRIPVSAELAERLRTRIADEEGDGALVREVKREYGALPVCANQIYLWAVRRDGAVLCMDHEAFRRPTEPETDPQLAYAAVAAGARRFPELAELVSHLRIPFLLRRGRAYRTDEVPRDYLVRAVAERRVTLIHGGARAFGSGDVWFTVATEKDLFRDDGRPVTPEGTVEATPADDSALPGRNVFDSTWEWWGYHDQGELEAPCRGMTPFLRVRYKQAVALIVADLLGRMPLALAARAVALRELLLVYGAAEAPGADLTAALAECAEGSGCGDLLFDGEAEWEAQGRVAPVLAFADEMPRRLGESVGAEITAENGWQRHGEAQPAKDWLRRTARRWMSDAACEVAAGEPPPDPAWTFEALAASPLPPGRRPARDELRRRLEDALRNAGDGHAYALGRYALRVHFLPGLLALPDLSGALFDRLNPVLAWAEAYEPDPTLPARADALAVEAERLGGDPLFAAPFRVIAAPTVAETARELTEAAGRLAARRFRAWTDGLLPPDRATAGEREAAELAEDALRQELARYLARRAV